jgi:hypothetical protein
MTGDRDKQKDTLRVMAVQGETLSRELGKAKADAVKADKAINDAEALLRRLGATPPTRGRSPLEPLVARPPQIRSWEEIAEEARESNPSDFSIEDILERHDIEAMNSRLAGWNAECAGVHELTSYDYIVAGAAGSLAAIADIFLVQVPKHPGFLGHSAADGGWLSNIVKERFGELLPEELIEQLEIDYPAPYDASTNSKLHRRIAGLGPRSHRMQSLGHDPLLGWIFGVRDILAGEFTAIGSDGRIIIQDISGGEADEAGVGLFVEIAQALLTVGGHLASDVATAAGLPPPLFGLLQFLQQKPIAGHSISDIARAMYRSGYDFRHFLAGGATVAIIEVIVRLSWTVRELQQGKTLLEAIQITGPRLRTTLLIAHTVAAAANAGKIYFTANPLSLDWAQWLAFFRYLLPQAHWLLVGQENARAEVVRNRLDDSWKQIDDDFAATWAAIFASRGPAVM